MAGGYENEDRMAELEELRREREKEARERMEKARRELEAPNCSVATDASSARDPSGKPPASNKGKTEGRDAQRPAPEPLP